MDPDRAPRLDDTLVQTLGELVALRAAAERAEALQAPATAAVLTELADRAEADLVARVYPRR